MDIINHPDNRKRIIQSALNRYAARAVGFKYKAGMESDPTYVNAINERLRRRQIVDHEAAAKVDDCVNAINAINEEQEGKVPVHKRYEDIPPAARAQLKRQDPHAFRRLHAAWERRGKPRTARETEPSSSHLRKHPDAHHNPYARA